MLVFRKIEPVDWGKALEGFYNPISMMKDIQESTFARSSAVSSESRRGMPTAKLPPRRTWYLILLFLCLAPYHGILDDWLFNDDFSWFRAARYEMTPSNLLTFRVVEFFRPLVNLSFYVMEKASPGSVTLHYAFNLVLHFLCTLLVFHLILSLLGNARLAAAASALFAVTSVHAAAIFWISARTTLLSTFFLLASLNILVSRRGKATLRVAGSIVFYILALASKEEAIAGLFLVGLLFFLGRETSCSKGPGASTTRASRTATGAIALQADRRALGPAAFAFFAALSALYLILRHAFMGSFFSDNWGLGIHAIRNVAGGFMYQLYPWPPFSLFYPKGTYLPEPANPVMPEILAVPLIILLIGTGYAAKRGHAMNLAIGWALLSLLPVSLFRYRFFSTVSISQSRYYYLSSVGTALLVAVLLSILWKERSRLRQGTAIVIFVMLCAGYTVRASRLERKWDDFTRMYREVVTAIVEGSGRFSGVTTLAVEGAPLGFPYLADAIALDMPGWKAVEVKGGKTEAEHLAPCLYVSYAGTKPKLMRMEKIGRAPGQKEVDP